MKNYFCLLFALIIITTSCNKKNDEVIDTPNAEIVTLDNRIDQPTTLENIFINPNNVDYIINGVLTVNARLTVMPGVRIQMGPDARIEVTSTGALNVEGTENNPIFIEGEEVVKGFWNYIRFRSNNPDNIIRFCTIINGGGSSNIATNAVIVLEDNARLAISNSVIANSASNGIKLRSRDNTLSEFENNRIAECSLYPLHIFGPHLNSMSITNDFTDGNGFNFIQVVDSDIPVNLNIPRVAGSYLFSGTIGLQAAVEIEAGTSVVMGPGARINVSATGSLRMRGNANNRITITGQEEVNGYWNYIRYQGSNSINNVIEYTDILYGGGNSSSVLNASVIIDGSRLALGHSSIKNAQFYGLKVRNNSTFEDLGNNEFENNNFGNTDGL